MANTGVDTTGFGTEKKVKATGRKLRLAFIGTGGIAGTHLNSFTKWPDVEIVGLCDIIPERMYEKMEKAGCTKDQCFTDYKKMLKAVKPDAVSVCTPNGVHAPAAIAASQAGCHVITEKPMAMTPKECQQMIDAAKKAKKKLVIGFQYRYHPNTQFIKEAADNGAFGDIMFARVQAWRRRGIPNWGVFGQKKLQGGGPCIDIGVHVLEMTHYVMGAPKPVAAFGNTWTYLGNKPTKIKSVWPDWDYKTYTVEDLAIGAIRFDNGAMLHLESSFAAHIEKDIWNFEINGTKGGARFDPPMIFRDDMGHMVNTVPNWVGNGGFGDLFDKKLRGFVDHVLNGQPTIAPGEAGMMVQKMLYGIYESASKGGKEVAIK
ncbi:MAG: Gfo/Idh/MocA family oxidoreductase [Phycisphaeraceae bacterium]